jgi:predicted nuclease of predicted toxin-antitoxin system
VSVPLYMDVHVHGAITRGLRKRGVEVLTAQDDGRRRSGDPDLLDRATALGRALVTNDADFLIEAAMRQRQNRSFAGIIFAHQSQVSVGDCIRDLELIAGVMEIGEVSNLVTYLPLR